MPLTPRAMNRTIHAAFCAAALSTAGCGAGHNFVSPVVPQELSPFQAPGDIVQGPVPDGPAAPGVPDAAPGKPQSLSFYKTQESSDWVAHTFKVQSKYARVIAVTAGAPPATVSVGTLDLKGRPAAGAPVELPVTLTVKTIQEASKLAHGGDLVAVLPGRYDGFTIRDKADAADDSYIHYKALGAPGEVVVTTASPDDPNWMILLLAAHHVIIEGFNVAGSNQPGKAPEGPNAGIMINGDFIHTTKLAHHVAIIGNFVHNHRKWGMHSVDSHSVLVQDNLFALSAMEHSAYVSDGSDNYVIRRNVFFGSAQSGLQCNIDATASLEKLKEHPALEDAPPEKPTREWALGLLAMATEKFGQNAFPDGRGFNFIIEDNVMNDNGRAGAAALNLAGVRESLIQNNLTYGNYSSGIVEWDNGNAFDRGLVDPGPKAPSDVTGAESLPLFGCFSNVIRNNTIMAGVRGRPALMVGSGSWGTRARNNIFINDASPAIELHPTGIWRFDGKRNVLNTIVYDGRAAGLRSLAISLPDEPGSVIAVARVRVVGEVVQASEEPWVIIEKGWWKLNPKRPDFHPQKTSPLLAGRGDPKDMPPNDLDGKKRTAADIGCYAAAR
jgi:hypothetical protein